MRTDEGIEAIGLEDVATGHHCLLLFPFAGQLSAPDLDVGLVFDCTRNESRLGRNGDDRGSESTQDWRLRR